MTELERRAIGLPARAPPAVAAQALGKTLVVRHRHRHGSGGGGRAELILSPELAAKLSSLFISVNPVFPTELLGAPFILRVTDGQIAPGASRDTLETAGSLD